MTTEQSESPTTATPAPRVAAVDDNTIIRDSLCPLFPAWNVVGCYRDAEALLAARPEADVVIVDLNLAGTGPAPALQGPDAVRAVAEAGYRVLVYTSEVRRTILVDCLTAGAQGIVHKAEPLPALGDAVDAVAAGQVVITQELTGLAELAERRDQLPNLSPREREVLAGRARGESFRSIARRLYITPQTATGYMNSVKTKFAAYLRDHSPADLEYYLGLEPSGLTDWQPSTTDPR
ncbi:response regulator transcription factor [Kitasatospora sp. NPDC051914]|uniref:response regulator transcription factor n=1 Tax=Kitasatospora sp. NPDC051914 TaxID=3154945 RepID=UPI0034269FBF